LPVTTATNERSFSTPQRLLPYLRSTMGQNQARNKLKNFRPSCKNVVDILWNYWTQAGPDQALDTCRAGLTGLANARGLALEYQNIPLLVFHILGCSPRVKIVELF